MMGLLNLGSLVLGLIAWILPIVCLMQNKKNGFKTLATFSILSSSACAISLIFQLIYNNHLVKIGDWSALMDTTGGVVFAATVLLIITVMLNLITLIAYRKRIPV